MSALVELAEDRAFELAGVVAAVAVALGAGELGAVPVAAVVGFFAGKSADSLRRAMR